jgi:hypothetical protein
MKAITLHPEIRQPDFSSDFSAGMRMGSADACLLSLGRSGLNLLSRFEMCSWGDQARFIKLSS